MKVKGNILTILALVLSMAASAQTVSKSPDILNKIEDSGQFAPLFPFQPTHNSPDNITNVRSWTGIDVTEAGRNGFITADSDRFVDGEGREIRFLGTNLDMAGCFPDHKSADALAKELTRYGINVVRLHYVNHQMPKSGYPVQNSFIEPVQLELFDYLVAKLKQNGIYVCLALDISRKFRQANGIEYAGRLPYRKNGIDNVDFNMIQLQKRFHTEFLNHVNPYTGKAYKDETAISMIELVAENSIVNAWYSPRYRFHNITEPYKSRIQEMWNGYLVSKYGDTENLKKVWLEDTVGNGEELIPDGVMRTSQGVKWNVQGSKSSSATWGIEEAKGKDKVRGKYYARVTVEKSTADKSFPKFYREDIRLKKGAPYCLKIKMKTDKPRSVTLRMGQAEKPWRAAGLTAVVELKDKWTEYCWNFYSAIEEDNARLDIYGVDSGVIDVADVSLVSGMDLKWPEDQTLELQTVEWPYPENCHVPYRRAVDFAEFLSLLESEFFTDLRNNVKVGVGAGQPVAGTQLSYGFNLIQAEMDFCDMHAYWCRPSFPTGTWDENNWNLKNESMLGGSAAPASVLTNIAHSRVLGKPFVVSEFDIPNLNFYSAEGNLMLAAMGAFQNWSGIMQYSWTRDTDYSRECMNPMFDMCSSPAKLAHFPACYSMFVRRDVRKGNQTLVYASPSSQEGDIRAVVREQQASAHNFVFSGLMKSLPLSLPSGRRIQEKPQIFPEEGRVLIQNESQVPGQLKSAYGNKIMKSSTGELTWDWQQKDAGVFMVDTRFTKVFSGFVRGRTFTYRGMRLTPGKSRLDWMTVSLTMARPSGRPYPGNIMSPGTYLLAATGLVHNTDAVVVSLDKKSTVSCNNSGGMTGTAPILCEGIEAEIGFAGIGNRMRCYALDQDGNRMQEVPVRTDETGEAVLVIRPEYKTIWYEIIVEPINR